MTNDLPAAHYQQLKTQMGDLLRTGRVQAGKAVNTILLQTYWRIERYIVEFEQKGNIKAEYGSELLDRLSKTSRRNSAKGSADQTWCTSASFISPFQKVRHCLTN